MPHCGGLKRSRTCIFSGGRIEIRSAKTARKTIAPNSTTPVMNRRWRSSRRNKLGPRASAASGAAMLTLAILHARVEHRIEQIDDKIKPDQHGGGDQQAALDHRIVAAEDRVGQ